MKNALIFIIFVSIVSNTFSQGDLSAIQKKQFLTNNQFKLTPSQIIANFKIAELDWLKLDEFSEPVPFESAYNLNVYDYFNLNEKYDSDLKKSVFSKTLDYKILLDSLKKIKADYLNSIFYTVGNVVGDGETFEMQNTEGEEGFQINYDLKKKGFFIGMGTVIPYQCLIAFCPKVIDEVEFKQINITKRYDLTLSGHRYTQCLFLPMDENTALEIENNRSQIEMLRIYNMTGIYTATFNDSDFLAENYGKACKIKVVKGGSFRLLIYNKVSDYVYFDKLYPAITSK